MKTFLIMLHSSLKRDYPEINVEMYVSRRSKFVHMGLDMALNKIPNHEKFISDIEDFWNKKKQMTVDFLTYTDRAKRPLLATPGSVGNDLFSAYKYINPSFDTVLIKTDLVICIPTGCYGLSGRSSVALKGV